MISVILPVYKVEKYIAKCIESLIKQKYKDFEIILVNDGSPDNSISIAENLLQRNGWSDYTIIHTENRGVSAARNTGIEAAKGEYIIMVDSDDVLSNDFLSAYAGFLREHPGLNIYSTGFKVVSDGGSLFEENVFIEKAVRILSPEEAQESFFNRKIVFLLPTLLIRRSFLIDKNIRFDEKVRYSEDLQFIWRCLCKNKIVMAHSDSITYYYILHSGSTMTASSVSKVATGFDGLKTLFSEIRDGLSLSIVDDFYSLYCFNLMHGASHMINYDGYKALCQKYNLKGHYTNLRKKRARVDLRIKAISEMAYLCPYLGYRILNKF